ncbi:MAG: polysaccharide deacetylase family protein [Candidatus Omnitrophica bacterium]|nr:polysaccharide deacetylase family protein [Candidatus Omnitrophota bacterium]
MRSGFKNIVFNLMPKSILFYKGRPRRNLVALTFDDGPHPQNTQLVLKILKDAGIKATFFLTGAESAKYPQLVKDIFDSGNEIGSHNFSHSHIRKMKYKDISCEIQQANKTMKDITGVSPKLFRPPYGELSIGLLLLMLFKKMTLLLWSVDSNDTYEKTSQGIRNRLNALKAGDIIVLHEDYQHTVDALPLIIKDIKQKGLRFGLVSELMEKTA